MERKINFHKFIIILLCVQTAVKIFLLILYPRFYEYDEVLVTEISKQPLRELITTIQSEPHPPGYFVFLKLLPVGNPNQSKIILELIHFSIIIATLLIINKTNQRDYLNYGILLIISSTTFLHVPITLKQDSLSFPLFVLFLALTLTAYTNKFKNTSSIVVLNSINILLLTTGYLYYIHALFINILLTIIGRKKSQINALFIQLVIISMYYVSFLKTQISINQHRFLWVDQIFNSIVSSFREHFTDNTDPFYGTDIQLIVFIALIIYALSKIGVQHKKAISVSLVAYIGLAYVSNLFVRPRFSNILFLLLCLIAGWGANLIKMSSTYKTICLVVIFYVPALLSLCISELKKPYFYNDIISNIQGFSQKDENIGLIANHPIFPMTLKKSLSLADNIYPINPFLHNPLDENVNKAVLETDGKKISSAIAEGVVTQGQFNKYIYVSNIEDKLGYYDSESLVLNSLVKKCLLVNIKNISTKQSIYYFDNCKTKL